MCNQTGPRIKGREDAGESGDDETERDGEQGVEH